MTSQLTEIALQMLGTIERMELIIPEITDTIRKALEEKAALAEPEPPADGKVADLVGWLRCQKGQIPGGYTEFDRRIDRVADLLERLAEPEPVGPSVEELAQLIYERAMAPTAVHCKVEVVQPWVSRGNSIAQDDARDCARAVLARWGNS